MFAKFYNFWKCLSASINSISFWLCIVKFFQMSWFSCMLLVLSNKNFVPKYFKFGFNLLEENIYVQYGKRSQGLVCYFSKVGRDLVVSLVIPFL